MGSITVGHIICALLVTGMPLVGVQLFEFHPMFSWVLSAFVVLLGMSAADKPTETSSK